MEASLSIDQIRASKDGIFFFRFQFRDLTHKRKKAFFCLNLNQREERLDFLEDNKSLPASSEHSLCNRLKKLCPKFKIKGWYSSPLNNGEVSFYIPLFTEGDTYSFALWLREQKPPVLELIDKEKNLSLCRCLYNSQFTKSKSLEPNEVDIVVNSANTWQPISDFLKQKNFAKFIRPVDESSDDSLHSNADITEKSIPQNSNSESLAENQKLKQQRDLAHKLVRKQKIILKNIEKAKAKIPKNEEIKLLDEKTDFLKSIAYKYPKIQSMTSQDRDPDHEKALQLGVDLEQSLGNNLDTSYKEKKSLEKSKRMQSVVLESNQKKLDSIQHLIAKLRSDYIFDAIEIQLICKEFEISFSEISTAKNSEPMGSISEPLSSFKNFKIPSNFPKCRCFVIQNDSQQTAPILILVSRNAREADELVKQSKGNDFWFHCVQGTGSHVILPFQKKFVDGLPLSLEKKAMILAIHYSDQSQSFAGEVYTSRRHNLRKNKDMVDGLWLMDRAKSKFIRYNQDELNDVLKCLHK